MDKLDELKRNYKFNLGELISQSNFDEARYMIEEYEKIFENDIDLYSIKAVINILEDNLYKAEEILKEGLKKEPLNYDIIYNLAFVYEKKKMYITSYRYYKKLVNISKSEDVEEINDKLKELENLNVVKEYNKRKKVLFIAHIFPPIGGSGVQRSLKFVKYLRDFGWEPIVITAGETRYSILDESMLDEVPQEVELIRIDERKNIDLAYANKLIEIYRRIVKDDKLIESYIDLINKNPKQANELLLMPDYYILWATEVLDKIHSIVNFDEVDVIYTTSGPYSDHIIGYYLKEVYNKPWVSDFRDEWTNNPYGDFDVNDIMYKLNWEIEKNILNLSDKIVTVTPPIVKNYQNIFGIENGKIHLITNGYDELDFINIAKKEDKSDKFTIIHNGLLYMIRTPITFMQAISNLIIKGKVEKSKLKVIFGFTENLEIWIEFRNKIGLEDVVEFLDYMPHGESLKKTNKADLLLLIVGPGDKNKSVYTGKIFEYLRLGKPILALSPRSSIVEDLINETNSGMNLDFNDVEGIENYILENYQKWEDKSLNKFEISDNVLKYERKRLTNDLAVIFNELVR